MEANEQRYNELAEKWLTGQITDAEKAEFLQWYNEGLDDSFLTVPGSFAENEAVLRERMLSRIKERRKTKVAGMAVIKKYAWAAAAAVIVLGLGTIFFQQRYYTSSSKEEKQFAAVSHTSISPGCNKAILTLSDGSTIILDTTKNGLIAQERNSRVIKMDNGQVAYHPEKEEGNTPSFNTLNTPVGGQYSIVLADGTKVWLNSSSSLRFPTAFRGSERVVELKGEAYFEVAKNAQMLFKVKVGEMEVNVLGTHFNIMAYDDETDVQTTLLEGSVRVKEKDKQVTIVPGEQVSRNKQGKLQTRKEVNTELVVAWKNGIFQFEETDLESILRQLSRWYNVQIINDQHIEGHFSGTIEKKESIENVLHMLELTGALHFTVSGRHITVHH